MEEVWWRLEIQVLRLFLLKQVKQNFVYPFETMKKSSEHLQPVIWCLRAKLFQFLNSQIQFPFWVVLSSFIPQQNLFLSQQHLLLKQVQFRFQLPQHYSSSRFSLKVSKLNFTKLLNYPFERLQFVDFFSLVKVDFFLLVILNFFQLVTLNFFLLAILNFLSLTIPFELKQKNTQYGFQSHAPT